MTESKSREELEGIRKSHVELYLSAVNRRIQRGEKVFLYETRYLPVDSVLLEESLAFDFDIASIVLPGLDGWEVVAVIPRTIGVGLTNVSIGASAGRTWGAASGGNIQGVHLILKKEFKLVNESDLENLRKYILESKAVDHLLSLLYTVSK